MPRTDTSTLVTTIAIAGTFAVTTATAADRSLTATPTSSASLSAPDRGTIGPGPFFGGPVTVFFQSPTKDTSNYANIGATGNTRPFVWASTFPGQGRQSSLLVMYDAASAGLPTGPDAERVWFESITFTACTWPGTGPQANYDETPDPWQTQLWPGGDITVFNSFGGITPIDSVTVGADPRFAPQGPDEDGNAPLELFGVRFNNGLSAETWIESSSGTPGWSGGVPNAEPVDFPGGLERSVQESFGESAVEFVLGDYLAPDGQTYDTFFPTGDFIENPLDGFDPQPLAIGKSLFVPDGTPGQNLFGAGQSPLNQGEIIPFGHRFEFEVNVRSAAVAEYFRGQLAEGWISLMMSQAAFGDLAQAEYSYWITKEGSASFDTLPQIDLDPSTLEVVYAVPAVGDVNNSGDITVEDLIWVIRGTMDPSAHQRAFPNQSSLATLDLTGDGRIDDSDILEAVAQLRAAP
ncbi:MAG: dockerin type I domain-containing protein [Planctomycetota bacterium]